jgi:hypothetical protein
MDEEERCSDEEAAEAYKEWFWHKECERAEDALEARLEQADLRRKEIKESRYEQTT